MFKQKEVCSATIYECRRILENEFDEHRQSLYRTAKEARSKTWNPMSLHEEPGISLLRLNSISGIKSLLLEWDENPPHTTPGGVERACKDLWRVSFYRDSETGERYDR